MSISKASLIQSLCEAHPEQANANALFDYYQICYQQHPLMQQYVVTSQHVTNSMQSANYIGYSNRTLNQLIPDRRSIQGAVMRGSLLRSGLIKSSGHELFSGCIVFFDKDSQGNVTRAQGIRSRQSSSKLTQIINWHLPCADAYQQSGLATIKELIHA